MLSTSAPHSSAETGRNIQLFAGREASLGNTDSSDNMRFLIHLTFASFSQTSRARVITRERRSAFWSI